MAENLTAVPGMKADIKVEAFYYNGQITKGTKTKVERSGYQTDMEFFGDTRLFDGKKDGGVITTFFWGNQQKKITVTIDLGSNSQLNELKITIPRGNTDGNYADTCTVFTSSAGVNQDQWTRSISVKNPYTSSKEAPVNYDWQIKFPDETQGRYVKLEFYSRTSPIMRISEVQLHGKRLEERKLLIPRAWRFEPEYVKGTVVQKSYGKLGSAIWVKRNIFDISLPTEKKTKIAVWVCYMDNGLRKLEVNCNDLDRVLPAQTPENYWKWEKIGECSDNKFNLKMYAVDRQPPAVDSVIFSADLSFNPNNSPLELLQAIPTISVTLGFADKLYKNNPDIAPDEFAREVIGHYKLTPPAAVRFVDDNGAILWNAKPIFPLAFYHIGQNDPRVPVTINSFIGGTGERKPGDRKFATITSFHAMWFAYDALVRKVTPMTGDPNIIMHYICDEPENVGVSGKDLQRMHALVKAVDPTHPTFVNVSAGTAGNQSLMRVSDLVGVDHYPVPNGRLYDIGYSVDMARVNSGGRPVIFVAQTFDWGAYGRKNSRWPTPDEITVMCFLPIIHGCRGLWLYEFPAPQIFSKTYIKDVNPQAWERIEKILSVLRKIEPELVGPEAEFPGKIFSNAPQNRPLSSRFAVSSDLSSQVFIAVNSWQDPASMTLELLNKNVSLEPICTFGVTQKGNDLSFDGYGCGVFRVKGVLPLTIRVLSRQEALQQTAMRLKKIIGRPEISVSLNENVNWEKAIDLLDSWQSPKRFDQAKIIAAADGLHIRVLQRFRKDAVAKVVKRDGAVWSDPSIELFFGKLNSRKFCQLQVNIINTQADLTVDMNSSKMFDPSPDFKWESKVSRSLETAEYTIFIPWKSLRQMSGTAPGETIGFNLASSHSSADWAGLSGGTYLNPNRFGIINFKKVSK